MLTLLLITGPVSGGQELRLNYGVIFKPMGHIQATNDYWAHTIEMALPKLDNRPQPTSPCVETKLQVPVCQLLQAARLQADNVRNTTFLSLNDTIKKIEDTVPEMKVPTTNTRTKRSLLPFIGKLSSSLFGTATEQDVRLLANHIQQLAKRTVALSQTFQHDGQTQASFMTAVDKRITNAVRGMKVNHDAIVDIGKHLWYTDHQLVLQARITGHLANLVQTSNLLLYRAEEMLQGVTLLTQGKLSPLLISPKLIAHFILKIQKKLALSHPNFHVINTNPEFYYKTHLFVYARNGNKIYITMKFPLSTLESHLDVYKVITVPVPVNRSSSHATQLLTLPNIFAISKTKQHYTVLSDNELLLCQGHIRKMCPSQLAMTPITNPSCVSALFLKQKDMIMQNCDFRFRLNALKTALVQISPGKILITNSSDFRLVCRKDSKLHKGCQFCIIKVQCGCEILSDNIYLPPLLHNCLNNSDNITKNFPVNLAILQHFFNPETHDTIKPDSLFTNEIKINIPQFQIYNHKFYDVIATDQQNHLSLKRMAQAAKTEQSIYRSLTEPFLDGTLSFGIDDSWLIYLVSGIASLIAAVSLMVAGVTLRKLKILALTIATLQQVKKSEALSQFGGTFNYGTTKKPVISNECSFNDKVLSLPLLQTVPYIVIIIVVTIYLLLKIYNRQKHTTLYLEITSGFNCVLLKVKDLHMCPNNWHFKASKTLLDIELIGKFKQNANIQWGDLAITNLQTGQNIVLSDHIFLTPWQSFKICKILKQPFQAYLLLSHNQLSFRTQICPKVGTCPHLLNDQNKLYPCLPP